MSARVGLTPAFELFAISGAEGSAMVGARGSAAKTANPPPCNTGGTRPFHHPLCPSNRGPQGHKTIIDTISWTIPTPGYERAGDEVKWILSAVLDAFPEGCEWTPTGDGHHGYPYQTQLVSNSLVLGWLAFGASHNKQWLYLTGTGLRHRREHGFTDDSLVCFCDLPGARLGRIDIALDLFDHGIFSVEQSIAAHAAGGYKLPRAPGNPHSELFQSDTKCEGYGLARTHYLGKRNASKRLRVYDKGLQLLGSLSSDELAEYRARGIVRADPTPEGCRLEEWTRVELIYKHEKDRPLNRDMILDRDGYFAGGYPVLAELLERSDGVRPPYVPKDEDCELARLIEAGRESYGGLIFFLKHERGLSDEEIIRELIGEKSAARLMVDKERPE